MSNNNAIVLKNVSVLLGSSTVLKNVSAQIPKNQLGAIVGPNGAGKSTLLKTIMGIHTPYEGDISILSAAKLPIAYVPQRENIDWRFPVSVYEVVEMGVIKDNLFWRSKQSDKRTVLESLEQVGMQAYATRQISELSGGQQQRVFIARALAQKAEIYLLDEPFAGLDAEAEVEILHVLQSMTKDSKSVIAVHHDLLTVSGFFDYCLLLNKTSIAEGPIPTVLTNENLRKCYTRLASQDSLHISKILGLE